MQACRCPPRCERPACRHRGVRVACIFSSCCPFECVTLMLAALLSSSKPHLCSLSRFYPGQFRVCCALSRRLRRRKQGEGGEVRECTLGDGEAEQGVWRARPERLPRSFPSQRRAGRGPNQGGRRRGWLMGPKRKQGKRHDEVLKHVTACMRVRREGRGGVRGQPPREPVQRRS